MLAFIHRHLSKTSKRKEKETCCAFNDRLLKKDNRFYLQQSRKQCDCLKQLLPFSSKMINMSNCRPKTGDLSISRTPEMLLLICYHVSLNSKARNVKPLIQVAIIKRCAARRYSLSRFHCFLHKFNTLPIVNPAGGERLLSAFRFPCVFASR